MPEQYSIRGRSSTEIAGTVEEAIRAGRFAPGAKLPPIRSLAAELAVSPMTVVSAYRDLRRRGLLTAAGRRGTRVSERPPLPVRTAPVVPANARDLVTGNPDPELLPSLTPAVRRLRPGKRLYGGAANAEGLVELARSEFARDGIAAPAIAVVGGALDGIERALVAHLRVGHAIAVEE